MGPLTLHQDDTSRTADDRNRRALTMLAALLELPDQRPGAWEAAHVEALETEYLAPIVDALTGADEQAARVGKTGVESPR